MNGQVRILARGGRMISFSYLQELDCRLVERKDGVGTFIKREGERSGE